MISITNLKNTKYLIEGARSLRHAEEVARELMPNEKKHECIAEVEEGALYPVPGNENYHTIAPGHIVKVT